MCTRDDEPHGDPVGACNQVFDLVPRVRRERGVERSGEGLVTGEVDRGIAAEMRPVRRLAQRFGRSAAQTVLFGEKHPRQFAIGDH